MCLARLGNGALCPNVPYPTNSKFPHQTDPKLPIVLPEYPSGNTREQHPIATPEPLTIVRVFPVDRDRFGAVWARRG